MLKKFIQTALLLVVLFTTVQSYAQVSQAPDGIQFQALATDANGHPAAGRVIYVKDAIIAKTATGTIVYSETFKVTASSAGIFTIVLGKGTYASGVTSIANIDWANGPFFLNLKVAVEPTVPNAGWNANNEYVDLGTSQFWSVPYALYAGNVKGADSKLNIADTAAMLKPYFTAINLKANIESPTFTGTVKGITKAMVGLGNVDNTSDIDKPISTATKTALDLKANAADVATALALKANAADVTTALDLKVDKVTGKALSTNDYTTAEKTKLAAITGTNTGDQDLSALAVAADVNAGLALKANTADVNTALALKANTANVASSLAAKADVVAVNNSIAAINTSLGTKADAVAVNNSIAAINILLNTKADVVAVNNSAATLNTLLATKENTSSKSVNITTDATSDTKYPSVKSVKTYVDAQVAGATIADADANTKGKIQLTGDLAGTAAAPTVPGLALKLDANQKGVANGVATLNAQGIIPSSQLPPVTLSSTNVVGSDAAMTALSSATVGSIAVRTDINKNYVLSALPASTLSNWVELLTPAAPVQAVNGYTGSVNLSKTDLGLSFVENTSDVNKPVSNATQTALDLKANSTDVNTALANKISTADATASLALKANSADVNTALATKISTTDATAALALKANSADVNTALATKISNADATAALALKLDANKVGIASGVASLDATGKVPTDQIPAISFSSVKVLASEAEMLALSNAVVGSVVIRTDESKNYVLAQVNPAVRANWIQLLTPAAPVQTVNGKTGTISISASDLGLGNVQNTSDANKPVSSAAKTELDKKVDKVTGKDLSTNDYTTTEKTKLAAITGTNTGDQDLSAYATNVSLALKANTASPTFTGIPAAPTAAAGTSTTQLATTAFVKNAVEAPRNNFYIGVNENLGLGSFTALPSQAGLRNTLIGNFTLQSKNTGDNTTALGHAAGNYFGSGTGLVTSVNKGLYLGAFARSNANNQTNEIVIGADALGNGSNTIQLGNTAIANTKTSGTLTAGEVTYPNAHGTANQVLTTTGSGTLTWTTVSSAANASSLSGTVGVANGGTGASTAAAARTNLGLVIGTDVQAPLIAGTDYLAPNGSAASLTNFPTFNQNTTGNAATATKLAASKTINGVAFDGSSDITILASASTLSGTVLLANGGTGATTAAAARTNLGLVIGTDVQAPLIAGTHYLAPTGSAAGLTNFPTFNQNTTGNAATATKLAASKTINGVAFDGSSDITILASASTLSGTVLLANGGTGATTAAAARTNLGLVIGTDVQAPLTAGTDYLAPTGSAAGLTNFPTFNQNTTGNAATATKLAASKTINGVAFDGSSDITIAASASALSGTVGIANGGTGAATAAAARTNLGLVIGTDVQAPLTAGTDYLAPTGSAAGLTNFPTFNQNTTGNAATATLATNATTATNVSGIVDGANGGTGVANSGKTITLGGNFQTSGGHVLTLTTSATTNVTLPSSGTLATVQQVDAKELLSNKSTAIDLGNTGTSDDKYPSQKAVKTYVDNKVVDLTTMQTVGGLKTFTSKLTVNSGTAGGASLEVNGASTNTTAFNASSGTSIDFTKSNLAYTTASASAGNFTLTGMKDGGTYTLAVQGATSGTAAFSGSNPSSTSFTFKSVNNAATTASKHTLYTFIVMGTTVYFSMVTGL